MIDRVYTGYQPGGLMKYLFGPGKYDEHENPRVVATWDGRPEQWQPEYVGPEEFDYDLDPLISALQAPAKAAGLPVSNPDPTNPSHARFFKTQPDGTRALREGYVFHLTLRNADDDRVLSDAEWAHIAEEMMHRSGVARRGDPGGVRWAAVRHDETGIHVQATLVRQDTARRVHPKFYKRRLRQAALAMEQLYGLTSTAPADGTAAANASRGEQEKAARQGRVPARVELRDAVAQAAAASVDEGQFERALSEAGYLVEITRFPSGDLRGFKVSRPGDVNAAGSPIWYSGSKLSPDLSMPRLVARWEQARRGASGSAAPERALTVIERARVTLRRDPSQVDGIAHAVGEVYGAIDRGEGRVVHGRGARWDRAARAPHRPVPATQVAADELRWLARGLSLGRGSAGLELTAALAALGLQIAAILREQGRTHQARAARQTAAWSPSSVPAQSPRPTAPVAARGPGRGPVRSRRAQGVPSRSSAARGVSSTWRRGNPSRPRKPGGPDPPQR